MITNFISNLGFPIAVCFYMFLNQREDRKAHEAETKGFIEAINNNTVALTKLTDEVRKDD